MSARADTWMPLYIGDYLADTMHLSGAEHGAYLLLIMHYWRNGPLPNDQRLLASIARTERKVWETTIGPVVRRFFEMRNNATLHHKRIDQEIANAEATVEQRRSAGKASAEARKRQQNVNDVATGSQRRSVPVDDPVDVPLPRSSRPSPSPSPRTLKEESRSLRSLVDRGDEFQAFWKIYPRKKEGAGACEKAWAKARKLADVETILDGLRRYEFKPDYLPMASTWLNEKRWMTEADTRPVTLALPKRGGRAEDLAIEAELDLSTPLAEQFSPEELQREWEQSSAKRGDLGYQARVADGGGAAIREQATDRALRGDVDH